MILAETLKSIGFDFLEIGYDQQISCYDGKSNFRKGYTIENFIKTVSAHSLLYFQLMEMKP